MAPLFSKDLFSISKVIGRKTKWPRFFGLPCIGFSYHKIKYLTVDNNHIGWIKGFLIT